MTRSDLLISLVKQGLINDKSSFRKVVEAIIAEERSMHHSVIAENLDQLLRDTPIDKNSGRIQLTDTKSDNFLIEVLPRKSLSDLVLEENTVYICQQFIQEQHRQELLRSYNLEPRNRILLIGPPGNGKTSLAEAIAEALLIPLFVVRYESVVGAYLGETALRLKKIFDFCSTRKCVLFFDEFETLGKERGDVHETGEIKRLVSSLLLQIDNLPSHVVVIGATNHPELLDRAVWRRFQIRLTLPLPTVGGLTEWFEKYQRRVGIDFVYSSSYLANRLHGMSYSEVEDFCLAVYRQYILGLPNSNLKNILDTNFQILNSKFISINSGE